MPRYIHRPFVYLGIHVVLNLAGFSTCQQERASSKSVKNASYVTIFCSFTDIHRSKLGIFENVCSIKHGKAPRRQNLQMDDDEFEGSSASSQNVQNVLSYLVTCLVSMGYQVNHFLMSSEEYGSCQKRERLILTIATPGLAPIKKPSATHEIVRASNLIIMRLLSSCEAFLRV